MATKPLLIPLLLPEDELLCSICQELFKNPVTIPCGHNFCMGCIKTSWSTAFSNVYCPHCRKKFSSKPELQPNTILSSVLEHIKKVWPDPSGGFFFLEDEINCDICEEGRELAAVKTCVTCQASFCSVHLTSHVTSQVLSKHSLCAPVGNINDMLCKKHKRVLELFCMAHRTAICWQCTAKHRNCKTSSIEEMRKNWKAAIEPVETEVENRENATKEALETLETMSVGIMDATDKIMIDVLECCEALKNTIDRAQNRVFAFLGKEKSEALQEIDKQKERLDNHNVSLSNIKTELAGCKSNDSYFNFCQTLPVLPPEVGKLEDIQLNGHAVELMIQDLEQLNSSLESQLSAKLQRREELQDKHLDADDFRVVSGHSKRRRYLLKYSSKVTFDPVSASASLRFSEDGLVVTVDRSGLFTWKDYQVNTNLGFRAVCSQEFTMGKHYWEVLPPKDMDCNWAVGVTCKNGHDLYKSLAQDKNSWCVIWHSKDKVKDEIDNKFKEISRVTQAKEEASDLNGQKLEMETSKEGFCLKTSMEQRESMSHEEKENQTQMSETIKEEDEEEKKEKIMKIKTITGLFASHNDELHLISQELPEKIGCVLCTTLPCNMAKRAREHNDYYSLIQRCMEDAGINQDVQRLPTDQIYTYTVWSTNN